MELKIIENGDWLHFLLVPLFIYCVSSFFTSIVGIIVGANEVRLNHNRKLNLLGAIGNSAYLVAYVSLVVKMWPVLMGV